MLLAVIAGVAGLYISYWANVPSGPAIVLLSGAGFGLALLFAPQQGIVWSWVQRRRLRHLEHRS